MKSLLVIGAGGYGRVVKEIAQLNGYGKIDFLDDNSSLAVGKIADVESLEDNSEAIIGKSCFICAGSVVNHNASVGNCCQIDCNATVSCGARVTNGTKVESCTVYR